MSSAAGRSSKATPRHTRLVTIGLLALVIGYASATHWAVATGHVHTVGRVLALLPVLAGLAWLALRPRRSPWVRLAAATVALALAALATRRTTPATGLLYPLPSILIYSALLWTFARTLVPGREALITRLARHVHGTLPDDIAAYTRQVNWAWCIFFAAMALTSLLLFAFAALPTWSLFVNVLSLPLIAAMFVVEYVYRVLRYRGFSHASLFAGVRAFRELGHSGAASGRGG